MGLINKSIKIIGAAAVLLAIVAGFALTIHLEGRRDDLSLRYILWKRGFYPYPEDHIVGAVFADNLGRDLLAGKSKQQVIELLPNTYSDTRTECQRFYEKELIGEDFLWFGEHCFYISFKSGMAEYVGVKKG